MKGRRRTGLSVPLIALGLVCIWDYIWPSGIGPRVAEPALMLINPYPWSAPLEEVRLKTK